MGTTADFATARGRIDYIVDETGCGSRAALGRWLGHKNAQNLDQWVRRNRIPPDGAVNLNRVTGAATHWTLTGEGEPFPDGARQYVGEGDRASRSFAHRVDAHMEQIILGLAALADWAAASDPARAQDLLVRLQTAHRAEGAGPGPLDELVRAVARRVPASAGRASRKP